MNLTRRYLKNQFCAADANKSGYLNLLEVKSLCKGLNIKVDREDLKKLFDKANTEKTDPASKEKGEVKLSMTTQMEKEFKRDLTFRFLMKMNLLLSITI